MNPVIVYVRRSDDRHGRTISFDLPDPTTVPQGELLELGFAIDGKQAVYSISRHANELQTTDQPWTWVYSYLDLEVRDELDLNDHKTVYEGRLKNATTLPEALSATQRSLSAFLKDRTGNPVQFV